MEQHQEQIRWVGQVRATTIDGNNNYIADTGWQTNIVTNNYLNAIASWVSGVNNTGYNPITPPTYIELGTGTGTPAVTDTNLYMPVSKTLQVCSHIGPLLSDPQTAQWVVVYTTNTGSYTEAGLFSVNGILFAHVMIDVDITVGAQTRVTWQITGVAA